MNRRWLGLGAVALFAVSMLAAPQASYAQSRTAEANSAEIRQVVAQFLAAFNRHDAQGWAAPFVKNADFMNIFGLAVHGRDKIEDRFRMLFAGTLKHAHRTATIRHIRFIKPDVAVVDASWVLVGSRTANGRAHRVRKGMFIWTMVKRDGHWKFANFYEFVIVPHGK